MEEKGAREDLAQTLVDQKGDREDQEDQVGLVEAQVGLEEDQVEAQGCQVEELLVGLSSIQQG